MCGEWTAFTPCTVTCGGGTKYKTRTCEGNCDGVVTKRIRDCRTEACMYF